jgi:mannose-6-phosphate isomerase-like protein (cupin superfamily)
MQNSKAVARKAIAAGVTRVVTGVVTGVVTVVFTLSAQEMKPTCNQCSATYIAASEIHEYFQRVPSATGVSDQQVRALNIGKSNVDIGVVYRGKLTGESPVAEHDLVSEVYHIIDGAATLVTGPDIVDPKPRPAGNENVRLLNGPGSNGLSIRSGVTQELRPGDVIVIPAGVGHWFTRIDDHIRYLMVRIDPDKVTPLKDAAAARADLAAGPK